LLQINATGNTEIFAQTPNGLKPAFVMQTDLQVYLKVAFTEGNLTAAIHSFTEQTIIINTFIGPVSAANLTTIINFFIGFGIEPALNKFLNVGVPIPQVEGVTLVNTQVDYATFFLMIGTDFSYDDLVKNQKNVITVN
jgi:hypothetical protein